MFLAKKARLLVAASVIALVAACDTAEERAEKHYQNSIELIENGDVDRALVELRNVFQLDDGHREALTLYASQMLKLGRPQQAYGHYLRLVERYPDEVEGRIILADLALGRRQWEEVERHGARAIELAPTDPRVEVVEVALAYRAAIQSDDASARREAARRAEELFERMPDEPSLAAMLVENYASEGDFTGALEVTNRAIPSQPANRELYLMRLGLLEQLGDLDALEGYLVELNELFPDETEYQQMILRYYMARGQVEDAEGFFRSVVSPDDEDLGDYASFVRFLRNNRGIQAAIEELDTALQTRPGEPMLTALAASLRFDNGDRDAAISQLEELLETAEPNADTRRFKVALARMLLATENEVGARKLVEEVLAEDAVQVDAIKLQATWMITDDRSNEAISMLRRALDSAPDDFEIMTLMAQAHARNGDRALARDLLSLAAETSGFAPEESVRYARSLIDEQEYSTAETTLISSLRARPDTLSTLVVLAEVYIRSEDWSRAEQVERNLRRIGSEAAVSAADRVRIALLNTQDRSDEAIAFLEGQFQDSSGDMRALAVLIQSYLQANDSELARSTLDAAMLENPDNDDLVFFDAALKAVEGDLPAAEERYRLLLEEYPENERLWLELIRIVGRQQNPEAVSVLVDQGLEALPDSANLLWAKASRLERELDIDGAIDIYERIYSQANSSIVAANNLASLLATYRGDDADSVDRAYRIARRLRGTDNPAFQDTYGWIAYLNGEYTEALEYLEPAAARLNDDPIVQYHLGMAYLAAERTDDAIAQFERALEIAGSDDPRVQFSTAREKLVELTTAPATQPQ